MRVMAVIPARATGPIFFEPASDRAARKHLRAGAQFASDLTAHLAEAR